MHNCHCNLFYLSTSLLMIYQAHSEPSVGEKLSPAFALCPLMDDCFIIFEISPGVKPLWLHLETLQLSGGRVPLILMMAKMEETTEYQCNLLHPSAVFFCSLTKKKKTAIKLFNDILF